jgi:PAS domain S-box-containing protein
MSGLAYILSPSQRLAQAAVVVYLGLVFTVGLLLALTDLSRSPFIALWLLVSVFAGLFGRRMLIGLFLLVNAFLALAVVLLHVIDLRQDLLIIVLAYELPMFASWLIWHHKSRPDHEKDRAYNELVRELSQVANKSEIVINAIADGVIAVDSQGTIQLINPAAQKIIGWGKQDALKLDYKSVVKLIDAKEQPLAEADDPVQQVLHTNVSVINNDLVLETISGRKLFISAVVSPIGTVGAGAIIVFRDITKEKQAEREQAEFISTASHEMRTPVATIEGYLGLALNTATAAIDERAQSYLVKAQESVRHLGRLFQDLLDISKIEDGRLKNNPKVVDMVTFVDEIVSNFQARAKEKGLVLLFKPSIGSHVVKKLNPVYYVDVDNDHLREVLSNLLENAVKYTVKGNVTVDITGDNERVLLTVHDTGIGIPPEDIPHLFQKFYRVDNTQTQNIGGTGLGLYLCRRLVEAMGGRLWVESKVGEGSTFFVSLARIDHEVATQRIEQAAEKTETPAG